MPKFAASLNLLFNEWPLLDRFAAARDSGFTAVECQAPYEAAPEVVARRARAAGVEVVLINTPRGSKDAGGRGLAALPAHAAEFRRSLEDAVIYAEALGARKIHVMTGGDASANEATLEASVRTAAERFARHGIDALLEPLNLFDNPGYYLSDFELAARVIKRVGMPNLRLQYDVYHRQLLHGDIVGGLERLWPIVGHVQIAGVPGRHEPGVNCEIDYACVLGALERLGYRGWIGCEYKPRAGTLAGLGWMKAFE